MRGTSAYWSAARHTEVRLKLEVDSDALILTRRPFAARLLLWLFILFCTSVLIVVRTQPALASTHGNAAAVGASRHDGHPVHEGDNHGTGGGGDGGSGGDKPSKADKPAHAQAAAAQETRGLGCPCPAWLAQRAVRVGQ